MSPSSLDDVRPTTGIGAMRGSSRRSFSTSSPSSFGSLRSSRTTAGILERSRPACPPRPKRKSTASLPSRTITISFAIFAWRSARSVSSSSSASSSTSRMNFSAIGFQGKEKHRTLARLGVGPDTPAVPVHDALDCSKTDAFSGIVRLGVQPLEGAEELRGIGHVEAGAVVAHEERRRRAFAPRADLDARPLGLRGELPGVADQVLDRRAQQPRITLRAQALRDRDLDPALRLAAAQVGRHLLRDLGDVDLLALEADARDLRKVQQILDQLPHALRR